MSEVLQRLETTKQFYESKIKVPIYCSLASSYPECDEYYTNLGVCMGLAIAVSEIKKGLEK